jgi:hypothetical protein
MAKCPKQRVTLPIKASPNDRAILLRQPPCFLGLVKSAELPLCAGPDKKDVLIELTLFLGCTITNISNDKLLLLLLLF